MLSGSKAGGHQQCVFMSCVYKLWT